jgi:hypothetical protein
MPGCCLAHTPDCPYQGPACRGKVYVNMKTGVPKPLCGNCAKLPPMPPITIVPAEDLSSFEIHEIHLDPDWQCDLYEIPEIPEMVWKERIPDPNKEFDPVEMKWKKSIPAPKRLGSIPFDSNWNPNWQCGLYETSAIWEATEGFISELDCSWDDDEEIDYSKPPTFEFGPIGTVTVNN